MINRSKGKASMDVWKQGEIMKLDIPVRVKKGHIEQFPRCRVDGAVQVDEKWYVSCYRIGEYPDEMKSEKHRFPLLEVDLKRRIMLPIIWAL